MLRRRMACLIGALGLLVVPAFAGAQVRTIGLLVGPEQHIPYDGPFKALFPEGLLPELGAGLARGEKAADGTVTLYVVTGRGPTADSPKLEDANEKKHPTRAFLAPSFNPSIGVLSVNQARAQLVRLIPIHSSEGHALTGLPGPARAPKDERPLSSALTALTADANGIDPKGIGIDRKDGHFWVGDEYGPTLLKVDRESGRILARYTPGHGLPAILEKRQPNRGFAAVVVTPGNRVIAAVQSILDVEGKYSTSKASFIRLVELDPATGKVRMFAYPHDVEAYKTSRDARIGGLAALSDTELLLVEQGKGKDKRTRALVYDIGLDNATDLGAISGPKGKELESLGPRKELEKLGVALVAKRKVVDLPAAGWTGGNVGGIALSEDPHSLFVISSGGGGVTAHIDKPATRKSGKKAKDPDNYVVDAKGTLGYKDEKTEARWELRPSERRTVLSVVRVP
jgi:hypothetical protein